MCLSTQNMVSIVIECNLLHIIFKQTLMEGEIFHSNEMRSNQNDPFENVKGAIKRLMLWGDVWWHPFDPRSPPHTNDFCL